MSAIKDKILQRIKTKKRGWVFCAKDFADLYSLGQWHSAGHRKSWLSVMTRPRGWRTSQARSRTVSTIIICFYFSTKECNAVLCIFKSTLSETGKSCYELNVPAAQIGPDDTHQIFACGDAHTTCDTTCDTTTLGRERDLGKFVSSHC